MTADMHNPATSSSELSDWVAVTPDELLRPSIVKIVHAGSGTTLGTGWVAGLDGTVVTCHHVIGTQAVLRLNMHVSKSWDSEGRAWWVVIAAQSLAFVKGGLPAATEFLRVAVNNADQTGQFSVGLAIERLLNNVDEDNPDRVGLVALAEDVLRCGPHILRSAVVHFAFETGWPRASGKKLRAAAMEAELDDETIEEIPGAIAGVIDSSIQTFANDKWEMLLAYRQRYGEERSDLLLMRKLFFRFLNRNDPVTRRLVKFWRAQPKNQRTPAVQKLLNGFDAGTSGEDALFDALRGQSSDC
jgi:hypothetical protein